MTDRAHGRGHGSISVSVSIDSNNPFLHQRLIDVHVDSKALKGLSESDLVDLSLLPADTIQLLQALLRQNYFVEGEDRGEDIEADVALFLGVNLD